MIDNLSGAFPATFTAVPINNSDSKTATKNIVFEYTGPEYKNAFGATQKSGSLFSFNSNKLPPTTTH
jgi:hypothetical protein